MRDNSHSPLTGNFRIDHDRSIFGIISLCGEKTSLYLRDECYFNVNVLLHNDLHGSLHNLKEISLIDCIGPPEPGRSGGPNGLCYFSNIFPHYVLTGPVHLQSGEHRIVNTCFTIDDATSLFYDFDTFGTIFDAHEDIQKLISSKSPEKNIEIGENPIIGYYTGKEMIFYSHTLIGTVYAKHSPSFSFGGPGGVKIHNEIFVNMDFDQPICLQECLNRTYTVCQFLEVLAGRPQRIHRWNIRLDGISGEDSVLEVYSTMQKDYLRGENDTNVQPLDVPLDGAKNPERFSKVLENWLERKDSWRDARGRYINCLKKGNLYDADRIIAAANMFDILPDSAVAANVTISNELADAIKQCRFIMKSLPYGAERDGALNVLGRIGKNNLKQKVRYRAQVLMRYICYFFPDLYIVTDAAVECRNYYVHGPSSKNTIDYSVHVETLAFLTDTLEFVFCASDLVEAGWDIRGYIAKPTTMSHPLGAYRVKYRDEVEKLKELRKRSSV